MPLGPSFLDAIGAKAAEVARILGGERESGIFSDRAHEILRGGVSIKFLNIARIGPNSTIFWNEI